MSKFIQKIAPRYAERSSLSKLMTGVWLEDDNSIRAAIEEIRMSAQHMTAADIRAAQQEVREARAGRASNPGYEVVDGVAHIPIVGHILKEVPCAFEFFGIAATSTNETLFAIDNALDDKSVKSIMLDVDSPGGTLDGLSILADAIFEARSVKAVNAHVSGMAASAAYWLASQADHISAEQTALVGSIGVYTVLTDVKKAFEAEGATVHVVKTGTYKGAGVPGSEITAEHLKVEQEIIDTAGSMFVDAISRGLGMERAEVEKLATGRVWFASKSNEAKSALELGLIHSVQSSGSAHAQAIQTTEAPRVETTTLQPDPKTAVGDQEVKMAEENKPAAAEPDVNTEQADELARVKAENAALRASQKAVNESQMSAIIDEGAKAGKITPAMRASVEDYASKVEDPKDLRTFVEALPVATHSVPDGVPAQAVDGVSDGARLAASKLGVDTQSLRAAAEADESAVNGTFEISLVEMGGR